MVGAMKAGTTTITDFFVKHPEVYTPPVKEPHFFVKELPKNLYEPSRFFTEEKYFNTDFPKPLHIANLKEEDHYKTMYSLCGDEAYRLDASTAYLHAPEAAQNIFVYNPDAKIIILKRDPLKRAFSHYKMDLGLGRTKRTFEEIMVEQIEAYNTGCLAWNTYLAMSFYKEPVAQYKKMFKEVLVIDFDVFIVNPSSAIKSITLFLGISNVENRSMSHKNESKSLKFQKVFYYLKKVGLKDYFSKIFSTKTKQRIFKIVSRKEKQPMYLSEEIRAQLNTIFKIESVI